MKDKKQETKKPSLKKELTVEELEERVALSVPVQKKVPNPPPYAPGTDYGLVKRENLKKKDSPKPKEEKLTVEELEERVALSVPVQKKNPSPPPYAPGTLYGLVKKENLKKEAAKPKKEKLTVEELEERVALSVPAQKKAPSPEPYMPGTYYGLVNRKKL